MMFIKGPIKISHINNTIESLQRNQELGAYTIFMGQIRADKVKDQHVVAIDYTAYEEMAIKVINSIKKTTMGQFDLLKVTILHSLGIVKVGEASLMIVVGAAHRKACLQAQEYIIEIIKKDVPVFGKEILEQGDFVWKENK